VIDLVEVYIKAVEAYNDGTIADEDKDFIYATIQ
jgi:hypothetical protein